MFLTVFLHKKTFIPSLRPFCKTNLQESQFSCCATPGVMVVHSRRWMFFPRWAFLSLQRLPGVPGNCRRRSVKTKQRSWCFWANYNDQTAGLSPKMVVIVRESPETCRFRNYTNLHRCLGNHTTWMSRWKLGSMVSKWILLINGIYWGYNPLILTFAPNFLAHPSRVSGWKWVKIVSKLVYSTIFLGLKTYENRDEIIHVLPIIY